MRRELPGYQPLYSAIPRSSQPNVIFFVILFRKKVDTNVILRYIINMTTTKQEQPMSGSKYIIRSVTIGHRHAPDGTLHPVRHQVGYTTFGGPRRWYVYRAISQGHPCLVEPVRDRKAALARLDEILAS
jgi:hypothetical protein